MVVAQLGPGLLSGQKFVTPSQVTQSVIRSPAQLHVFMFLSPRQHGQFYAPVHGHGGSRCAMKLLEVEFHAQVEHGSPLDTAVVRRLVVGDDSVAALEHIRSLNR